MYIEWDSQLYDETINEPSKANNSNVNEDLGQIEYLFSDKTGTLTENVFVFKKFTVDNVIYEGNELELLNINTKNNDEKVFLKLIGD